MYRVYRVQRRDQPAFHIEGAASIQSSSFDHSAPRIVAPEVHWLRTDHIYVARERKRPAFAAAANDAGHVRPKFGAIIRERKTRVQT